MVILTHRSPIQFCLQSNGFYEAVAAPGGVASVVRALFLLQTARNVAIDRVRCVAAAVGNDRAALASGTCPPADIHLLVFDETVHGLHYDYLCNSVLWFVLHDLYGEVTLPEFDDRFASAWRAYTEVNRRFAEFTAGLADPGETIIVNDYQLALVPRMLRTLRPDAPIIHFFHTPFPDPTGFSMLPDQIAQALIDSWRAVPLGFQTKRWEQRFRETAIKFDGLPPACTFLAPLGPDATLLRQAAHAPEVERARAEVDGMIDPEALMVLRMERLDPSKNTVRGIQALDLLLNDYPCWRTGVQMLICLIPSRQGIAAYDRYLATIREEVNRVNERWGTPHWQPITLLVRDDYFSSLAALQRYDVLFVSSTSDGMNLVAKEGPILNQRNGVLCLSEEAGAFAELESASLRVHPYDTPQTAEMLHMALSMPADERAARARHLQSLAEVHTPATWLTAMLEVARLDHPV